MILKRRTNIYIYISLFFLVFSFSFPKESFSDFFSEIATQFNVDDARVEPGDIISKKDGKLIRASSPYDEDIFGIVATNPIAIVGREDAGSVPIVTSGVALVKVDSRQEEIKKGDFITSSSSAGVGQKAFYSGFVVGRALEDFNEEEGVIEVFVDPHESAIIEDEVSWEEMTFWEAIGRIVKAVERDVPQVLRYLLATILVAVSFAFGLYSFSRTLKDGIKGISRNPLAKGSIRFAMTLNLIGILVVTITGLALALFIITL